ncbi:ankyrin repeat domain protein, partial [Nephila pilipes]
MVLQHAKAAAEVEELLFKAGTAHQKDYSKENFLPKSRTRWDDLIPNQKNLNEFFDKVHRAQDMKQLEEVVNQVIRSGVRFNFPIRQEYSEDNKIDVAKITDGARSLELTQGEIEYGRNIIKIGKSEVEIITNSDIKHCTHLADNSNIVLTFYTSLGELEVNLYPRKQYKIIVEVSNKKKILEKLKNCKEELGKNCAFASDIVAKKKNIVDVLRRDENGLQAIVEMQVAKGFQKRVQYDAAKAYSRRDDKGDEFHDLKEIIFIAIA